MELKELQDKHVGKPGFVIGSGPSLHFQDIEALKGQVTLSVNAGIVKAPWSTYFVTDDIAVTNWSYFRELANLDTTCLFFEGKIKNHTYDIPEDRMVWFTHKSWYVPSQKKYYPEGLMMTKEAEKPIIGARTSTGTAVHLAYIMGCDPIVLVGSDCCFIQSRRYFWQFDGEKKPFRHDNVPMIFLPNRGRLEDKFVDNNAVDFIKYFNALGEQADKQNIDIVDVSGGLLKCFRKMDYEDMLEQYIGEQL